MPGLVLRAFRRSRSPQTAARISKQRIAGNVYLKSSRYPDCSPTGVRERQRWALMEGGRQLDLHHGKKVVGRPGAELLRQGYERTGADSKLTNPNAVMHELTTKISGVKNGHSQEYQKRKYNQINPPVTRKSEV